MKFFLAGQQIERVQAVNAVSVFPRGRHDVHYLEVARDYGRTEYSEAVQPALDLVLRTEVDGPDRRRSGRVIRIECINRVVHGGDVNHVHRPVGGNISHVERLGVVSRVHLAGEYLSECRRRDV